MKMPTLQPRLVRAARRLLLAAGILAGLYAILGFFVLPAVLKAQLPPRLSRLLGREVQVARVRLNPFALSATVEGFAVKEKDGSDFFGWDRLYLNLRLSTLLTRTVALNSFELTGAFGRVVVDKGDRLNFSDILDRLQPTAFAPAPKAKPRPLRIGRLALQGARLILLDRSLREPFATTLGPVSLELTGFSTEPDSQTPFAFSGRTELGETFAWQGGFSLAPLESHGTLAIGGLLLPRLHPFYGDQVAFLIADGRLSAHARYAFQWSEGSHSVKLLDGSLDLQDLKLARGHAAPEVVLPRMEMRGLQVDLIKRSLEIGALSLQDGRIAVTRAATGEIDLLKLLTPLPSPQAEPVAPFQVALKKLRLKGFQVRFQDLLPVRPVQALIEDLDLTLKDFSLAPGGRSDLKLSLKLNGQARLAAEGSITPLRPAAELTVKIDGLELAPFDPYLAPAVDVRLNRGSLSLDGQLSGVFANGASDYAAFKGDLRLEHLEAADGVRGEPFLGYRSLALTGLDVRTNPNTLTIQNVELVEPDQRLVVAQDGTTNVGRALKLAPAVLLETPHPALAAALATALPPSQGPPFRLSIAQTHVLAGRLSFIDRSLEPNAAFLVTNLAGTATSLSTEPDTPSLVDFTGLAGGLSPLHIHGHAMPLRKDQDTDVSVEIQASELSDFSPYAGKYLGYTIHKGKLGLNAQVRIQQRQLQVLLKTRLNQFYLGEKVESPEALHLPVKLCLSILRDRSGLIEMDLPVSGSLDDPDLHYGKIVWNAFLNVMGKVITSPFSWLAKLGGAPEHDLSFVAFAPGSAVADPVAVVKLQALAKALTERPDLSLEMQGAADPGADAGALKQEALEQLLRRTKGAQGTPLSAEERAQCLQLAFQAAFQHAPKAAGTPVPQPPPLAEMEQRLLASFNVGADDLRQLADLRTKALLQVLRDAQVDPDRLFEITGMERAAKEGGSRVYFGLK